NKILKRIFGFTLAEVLITLTIIGVVAALTVPNLYAYYQKQQYVTELKKVYTEISQALKLMMADEGVNKLSTSNTLTAEEGEGDFDEAVLNRAGGFLKKYFKVIKDCGMEDPNSCFAQDSKGTDGTNFTPGNPHYCVIIASGASICMRPANVAKSGTIIVDVNGLKKPNIAGRDIFSMAFFYDGSIDGFQINPQCRQGKRTWNGTGALCGGYGNNASEARENYFSDGCLINGYGSSCFGKILNDNWKMDY
ncbi:MAG TPA: type II secretion system protein, partial [Candidatus Gastranaerophilaceae bacterium]|nr:type II secretion system protein [Candidatus Gastranaerophilaceae bacterium]